MSRVEEIVFKKKAVHISRHVETVVNVNRNLFLFLCTTLNIQTENDYAQSCVGRVFRRCHRNSEVNINKKKNVIIKLEINDIVFAVFSSF